jgi:hypothetical protein
LFRPVEAVVDAPAQLRDVLQIFPLAAMNKAGQLGADLTEGDPQLRGRAQAGNVLGDAIGGLLLLSVDAPGGYRQ